MKRRFGEIPSTQRKKEDNPPCPACKSTNTAKKEIRNNNGIIGPGYSSWVVDSWYSCLDCGVRFDKKS